MVDYCRNSERAGTKKREGNHLSLVHNRVASQQILCHIPHGRGQGFNLPSTSLDSSPQT